MNFLRRLQWHLNFKWKNIYCWVSKENLATTFVAGTIIMPEKNPQVSQELKHCYINKPCGRAVHRDIGSQQAVHCSESIILKYLLAFDTHHFPGWGLTVFSKILLTPDLELAPGSVLFFGHCQCNNLSGHKHTWRPAIRLFFTSCMLAMMTSNPSFTWIVLFFFGYLGTLCLLLQIFFPASVNRWPPRSLLKDL